MSDEVPIEAFTLVESPLPIPTAFGFRLWFQGMTIFPSATIRRTYSGVTFSLAATVTIWSVRMPSRASSIWVFIGTPLRIEIFNGTRKKRKLPIKADSIERRQVLFSDFNPLLSDFSAVSVSHSLFFAFEVPAARHERPRQCRRAAKMEMDVGGKAVL